MSEAEPRIRFGDADEFIILSDAVSAGKGAGFDLAGAEADSEVSDGDILGLTGTVRHDGLKAGFFSEEDSVDSFGQSADLVRLNQNSVAAFFGDAAF